MKKFMFWVSGFCGWHH